MDIQDTNLLERAVLRKLLEGEDNVLGELRFQLAHATVISREMTGVGFYLSFSIPEVLGRITDQLANIKPDFCFGDVGARIDGLENGAGFLLWITDGRVECLEGYTNDGLWPPTIENFHLNYFSEPRDMAILHKSWLLDTN